MKRALVLLYVLALVWCTGVILWRRLAMDLVPTQVPATAVYATVALNSAVAVMLIRRWSARRFLERK